jgi:hypothetical protein
VGAGWFSPSAPRARRADCAARVVPPSARNRGSRSRLRSQLRSLAPCTCFDITAKQSFRLSSNYFTRIVSRARPCTEYAAERSLHGSSPRAAGRSASRSPLQLVRAKSNERPSFHVPTRPFLIPRPRMLWRSRWPNWPGPRQIVHPSTKLPLSGRIHRRLGFSI